MHGSRLVGGRATSALSTVTMVTGVHDVDFAGNLVCR